MFCQTAYGAAGYSWPNFHSCFGVAPYGAVVADTQTAGPNSCCSGKSSFVANLDLDNYTLLTAFEVNNGAPPPLVSAVADVEIRLVSGSFGGYVGSSTFRVVNHGPHNAYGVVVSGVRDLTDNNESGDYAETISIADGFCYDYRCHLSVLPLGDRTTFTVRWEAFPDIPGDTSAANLPSETLTCATATVTNESNNHDTLTADPNLSNNTASCMRGVPVTVALGGSTPPSRTVASGSSNVPMLEFLLTPTSQQSVIGVTVQASGSGNELLDVSAVHLYVDKNGNGMVDAGDSVVASGTFTAKDGSVTLAVNPGLAITAPTALLVTYSFTLTIAERLGGGLVLAMLPLLILPSFRRRKTLLAMLIVMLTTVAITACGGDSSTGPKPGNGSVTFKSTLTGITTSTGTLSSLAVSGATITVNK